MRRFGHSGILIIALVLILASSLGLLAALYAGALVKFLLAEVSEDASLCAVSLKTLKSTVKRLVLLNDYFAHSLIPSLRL